MRYLLGLVCLVFLCSACDDGDIITVDLLFEDPLTLCSETSESYLIYKTKTDQFESLSILIPNNDSNDLIFNPIVTPYNVEQDINQPNTRFNYRTYDADPANLLCSLIAGNDANITNDYEAQSGQINSNSTFVDADDDGIPSELEGQDPNGDGDFSDAQDTDGDDIPDYLDEDDDNDNILTKNENPDPNGDGDFSDAQNTDADLPNGDTVPDYLDNDDDGDGVFTKLEDEDGNKNPRDDFDEESINTPLVNRYLDNTAIITFDDPGLIENTYDRHITVLFDIINTDLQILNTDSLRLGTFTITKTDFNTP